MKEYFETFAPYYLEGYILHPDYPEGMFFFQMRLHFMLVVQGGGAAPVALVGVLVGYATSGNYMLRLGYRIKFVMEL